MIITPSHTMLGWRHIQSRQGADSQFWGYLTTLVAGFSQSVTDSHPTGSTRSAGSKSSSGSTGSIGCKGVLEVLKVLKVLQFLQVLPCSKGSINYTGSKCSQGSINYTGSHILKVLNVLQALHDL